METELRHSDRHVLQDDCLQVSWPLSMGLPEAPRATAELLQARPDIVVPRGTLRLLAAVEVSLGAKVEWKLQQRLGPRPNVRVQATHLRLIGFLSVGIDWDCLASEVFKQIWQLLSSLGKVVLCAF